MAIQAVPNQPIQLNHYLSEVPEKNASSLRCKSIALNVLEKICWVAFIAILGAVLTVSYSGIILTGNMQLLLVGLALLTPAFMLATAPLRNWSSDFSNQAQVEQGVADELKQIEHWQEAEIEQFYREQQIRLDQRPIGPDGQRTPLRSLLPLIARFKYMQKISLEKEAASRNNLADQNPNRTVRLNNRRIAWHQHELEAIPRAFDAAVILQCIEKPFFDFGILKLGEYRAKSYEERSFDRDYEPKNDDYFVFHPDLHRESLTLREIEADMSPRALRLKLFPTALRA